MKFKFKNIVLVSLLAVAGILGVSSAIITKQASAAPVVEKADAYSNFYMIGNLGYAGNDGSSNWNTVNLKLDGKDGNSRDQWVIKPVYIAKNAEFKFKKGDTWLNVWKDGTFSNFDEGGYGNWKCTTAGWYNVYYKDNGNTNSNVWIESASAPTSKSISFNLSNNGGNINNGNQLYIYYAGADGTPATTWPGLKVTASSNIVTYNIPNTANVAIINNNSKQTIDVDPSSYTAGKTLYVWSSTSDSKYVVSEYPSTGYYLRGDHNSWSYTTVGTSWTNQSFAKDQGFKIANVTGYNSVTHIGFDSSKIRGNAKTLVKDASDSSGNNITFTRTGTYTISFNGTYITITDTNDTATPTTGCYLVGDTNFISAISSSGTSWNFNSGMRMTDTPSSGNAAQKNRLYLPSDCTFRVRRFDGTSDSYPNTNSPSGITAGYVSLVSGNYVTTKAGYYNIFVNTSYQVYISLETVTLTGCGYFYQGSQCSETVDELSLSNSGLVPYGIAFTPEDFDGNYTAPSGTNYAFEGWYNDSDLTSKISSTITLTSDTTKYVKFVDEHNYTVTYYYVVDGVQQDKLGGGNTGSQSVAAGTPYGNLSDPTLYGCSFAGWYTSASCDPLHGIHATDVVTGNTTVYAKMSSNSDSKTVYFDVPSGQYSDFGASSGYTYVYYYNGNGSSESIKLKEMTAISVDGNKFFALHIPNDAAGFVLYSGTWGSAGNYYTQTVDLHIGSGDTATYSNGHNVFVVGGQDSGNQKKHNGTWVDIAYYALVCTDSSFDDSKTTTYNMSNPSDASTGNVSEMHNIKIPANGYLKYEYVVSYSDNIVKKEGKTIGGVNQTYTSSEWATFGVSQQTEGAKFASAMTINLYLAGSGTDNGKMFIVDCSGVEAAGFIYISSQYSASQIKVTCDVNGSTTFSNARLSTVEDTISVTNLTFNSVKGMIKVPLYNLKKDTPTSSDVFTITLSSEDGSKSTTLTGVTILSEGTANYHVKLDSGSSWSGTTAVSSTNGVAAIAAFDIAKEIASATNASVCNIEDKIASVLCTEYDNASGNALLTASTVSTWETTVGDSGDDVLMPYIRAQLGNVASGKISTLGRIFSPYSLFGDENNVAILITIISSSVALLSVTALSILVIRKRKSKEQ